MGSNTLSFKEQLKFGQTGESEIAQWLRDKGYTILPVYEKIVEEGKGPQLFLPNTSLVAPDMLTFKGECVRWVEAKRKTAFTWHRITSKWVTGIDLRHYSDYLKVDDCTPWPVWLMFLHLGGQAKDSPADSPTGLFGNELSYLRGRENHRHMNWGTSSMVYWAIDNLKLIAPLDEVASRR